MPQCSVVESRTAPDPVSVVINRDERDEDDIEAPYLNALSEAFDGFGNTESIANEAINDTEGYEPHSIRTVVVDDWQEHGAVHLACAAQ